MIPFAICGGYLYVADHEDKKLNRGRGCRGIEIRLLDLWTGGFSFRVSKAILNENSKPSFDLYFYRWEDKEYEEVKISQEQVTSFLIDRENKYYDLVAVETINKNFCQASGHLSHEYLDYINYKLNGSDEELSSHLCNYPAEGEEDYCEGRKVMENEIFSKPDSDMDKLFNSWHKVIDRYEFAISLENKRLETLFLGRPFEDFCIEYFQEANASRHPISRAHISRVYVGNSFCPNLFPGKEELIALIDKARECQLEITLVLAPLNETIMENIIKLVLDIIEMYGDIELQVNDMGTFTFLKDKARVTRGILLHKSRRDPRNRYRGKEDCFLSRGDKEAFIPFYQTNTGTFCPLHAKVTGRERNLIKRVTGCPKYCEDYEFVYPKHLKMVGNYNSLFGLNEAVLKDASQMESCCPDVERLVINL